MPISGTEKVELGEGQFPMPIGLHNFKNSRDDAAIFAERIREAGNPKTFRSKNVVSQKAPSPERTDAELHSTARPKRHIRDDVELDTEVSEKDNNLSSGDEIYETSGPAEMELGESSKKEGTAATKEEQQLLQRTTKRADIAIAEAEELGRLQAAGPNDKVSTEKLHTFVPPELSKEEEKEMMEETRKALAKSLSTAPSPVKAIQELEHIARNTYRTENIEKAEEEKHKEIMRRKRIIDQKVDAKLREEVKLAERDIAEAQRMKANLPTYKTIEQERPEARELAEAMAEFGPASCVDCS